MLTSPLHPSRPAWAAVLVPYALSGFVSLGYQVAWFRIFTDWFGATNLTFALVVSCFIGGLGTGSLLSRRIAAALARALRLDDQLRVYGLVELLVAATAALTLLAALVPAGAWGAFPYRLEDGVWVQSAGYRAAQVGLAAACVFVPCLFMGVTFPLLCHAFLACRGSERLPASLYAWNTLGACAGVLACLFVLVLYLGHGATFVLMIGLNAILGAYFLVKGGGVAGEAGATGSSLPSGSTVRPTTTPGTLVGLAVLSGLLAGALEGDLFKRIGFVIGNDPGATMPLISFWAILAIFAAAVIVHRVPRLPLDVIKAAFAAAVVCCVLAWHFRYAVIALIEPEPPGAPVMFPTSMLRLALFTGVFVFPPYLLISLLLPWLCVRLQGHRRHLGLAYGLNTGAFCVGLLAFVLAAPGVNIFYSTKLFIVLMALGAAVLMAATESGPPRPAVPACAAVALAIACVLVPSGFDRGYFAPGSRPAVLPVRALKSDGAHTTFVVDLRDPGHNARLYFGTMSMSGTERPAQSYMRLMAHVPLLAQQSPSTALLICYGVGNTASAIAAHGSIDRIDVVDLNRRVFETAPEFAEFTGAVHLDPRLRLIHDDGRSFLRKTRQAYDLITSEPPPPLAAGVYRLYSREYYESALEHLRPAGAMTQWLPLYQLPPHAAELIVSTFVEVFPHALVLEGWRDPRTGARELILAGSRVPFDLDRLADRFDDDPRVVADLARIGVRSPADLLARVVRRDEELREAFAGLPVLSDQNNRLAHVFLDPYREPSAISHRN